MAEWNPSSTLIKGIEWLPAPPLYGAVTLDSVSKAAVMSWKQTEAEDVGSARVSVGTIPQRGGVYFVEVFDNENMVAENVQTLVARPNEDVSGAGTGAGQWREDDNTTTNLFDQIDETSLDTLDYIFTRAVGTFVSNGVYYGRFSVPSLTSLRVLAVRMNLWARSFVNPAAGTFSWGLNLSGTDFVGGSVLPPYNKWTLYSTVWPFNPLTGEPWLISEVAALDTTDEFFLRFVGATGRVDVAYVDAEIAVCNENRLALGSLDDRLSGLTENTYNTVTLTTPTGGTWTKDSADRHIVSVRRASSGGILIVPTVDAGSEAPPARGFDPTLDPTFGYATAMGDPITRVFGFILRDTAGPTDLFDSQPYTHFEAAYVYAGTEAAGHFSDAAAADYSVIRLIVNKQDAQGDLLVSVHRTSDNVQFGATATISELLPDVDDLIAVDALGSGWYRVGVRLPTPATLTAGTQFYIRLQSPNTSGSNTDRWITGAVGTLDFGNIAGFGGTTDMALTNGVLHPANDLIANIAQAPVAPADFTATLDTVAVDPALCGVDEVGIVVFDWTPTALGELFAGYSIEERVGTGPWCQIKEITGETIDTVPWYEAPRNMNVTYRMRVLRADGAASPWVESSTFQVPSICAELIFTSDQEPSLTVALDRRPDIAYRFLDADEEVLTPIYGRNRNIASMPLEEMGVEATFTSVISVADRPAPGGGIGLAAFDALRAFRRATDLPYVCLLDHYGTRLFVSLAIIPDGSIQGDAADRHVAQIRASEVSEHVVPTIHAE